MKDISYQAPRTLGEAVALLGSLGTRARVLAGGTDLIVQLREDTLRRRLGGADPDTVVDVKRIPELMHLRHDAASGLSIGAAVPCSRIYSDAVVRRLYPCLLDAASLIGSVQIQNRASLGGNLCNASPAADGVGPLIALDATLQVAGPRGARSLRVEELCIGPGKTALAEDEILVSIHLPLPAPRSGAQYLRFIPRNEMDIAVAGAAAAIELEEDLQTIRRARVALVAVAPTPLLVSAAGSMLAGQKAGPGAFEAAAEAARQAARPISDLRGEAWQRKHLAQVLTRRALEGAFERARKSLEARS